MSFETTESLLEHAQGIQDPDEAAFALKAARREMRLEAMTGLAALAEEQLKTLENIRRLLAYAIHTGRANAGVQRFAEFLGSCPKANPKDGIRAQIPRFEWMRKNSAKIKDTLAEIV